MTGVVHLRNLDEIPYCLATFNADDVKRPARLCARALVKLPAARLREARSASTRDTPTSRDGSTRVQTLDAVVASPGPPTRS